MWHWNQQGTHHLTRSGMIDNLLPIPYTYTTMSEVYSKKELLALMGTGGNKRELMGPSSGRKLTM